MSSLQAVVLAIFGGLAGFAVGSFACVVIERLPVALDEPDQFGDLYGTRPWREVLGGNSRCSSCGAPIRAVDKIPFVSWLVLQGRCRGCNDRIPAFHPGVELAVPLIGAALVIALEWGWWLLPVLWLVPVGIAVSVIDVRTYIVPTKIVWPAFGVSLVLSVIAALVAHHPRWLFGGLVGIVVLSGPLFAIWFIMPRGMGFGDVRLTVLLGWTLGFVSITGSWVTVAFMAALTLTMAAVIGIVFGIVGLSVRGRNAKVPFGPSLVLGTLIAVAFAEELLRGFAVV